jgi:galactose mutarotase-like enzyme
MTVQIENEFLIASFAEKGAELVSLKLKENDLEYIWQADPAFWARHTPVLFPIVGRLKDDTYMYQNQAYHLSQHGFARDCVFEVLETGPEMFAFSLKSTDETKKNYPFDFELVLTYTLTDHDLTVHYQVANTGTETMYFSIGGHPAFNVPLDPALTFEDYYLSFHPKKSRTRIPLNGPYADFKNKTLAQTNTDINLTRKIFEQDALIFETKGANTFTIKSDESIHSVSLSLTDMPYVGIWSPFPKEAPFVCIEPWCGIADAVESNGQLVDKAGINTLPADELFKAQYVISVE